MLNTMLSARNKREIRISVIKNLWSSEGERQRVELKQYRMINTEVEGCWGRVWEARGRVWQRSSGAGDGLMCLEEGRGHS